MAKRVSKDESSDIKKLLDGLYKIVQTTNATSKEQIRINRELLKTMALLQAGFVKNEEDARQLIENVREGLEVNDEYAKQWLSKMGATGEQIDDIIDKFRDLEKLDVDLIDNAEDYLDLLERRYDVLEDTADLTRRLLTNHDAITRAIRASKDVASKLAGPVGDVNGILDKMVAKKVDVSSMFDGVGAGIEGARDIIEQIDTDLSALINNVGGSIVDVDVRFSPLTDDLDTEVKSILESIETEKTARLQGLQEYFSLNKKLQNQITRSIAAQTIGVSFDVDTGDIVDANGLIKRGTQEYQAMIQQLDDIAVKNDITSKLNSDFGEIVNLISIGVDRTDEQSMALKSLLTPMGLAVTMLSEQVDLQNQLADNSAFELMRAKEQYKVMASHLNQLQTAEQIVLKIGSGFEHLNAIMPTGIGEFLGLSKVSSQLIEAHKKGVQSFVDTLSEGESNAAALRSYYAQLGPSLSAALNPLTVIVASTVLLVKFVSMIVDRYKEVSTQLNVSLGQSKKLLDTQLDILTSQKNQFATMEDISAAQAAMIGSSGKVYGLTDKASKELTLSLIETGKVFGYGVERAVELHSIFSRLGADDRLADNLQRNLGLLSESANISPQIVAQDLVDSAEEVSIYFAGLPVEAAKAAIRVRQMGMSLKQAGSIAQKMLNLEGFMTDMYELQAMTAGGIDFSRAFDLGLAGDMVGMTEEIMNNIGTTSELNRMDYLTRMKIANTLGISVEELAKSVKLREDMIGMAETEQAYIQANLSRMGDISNASKEEIRNRMQQLQSTDRLNVAWDKIKGTLVKSLLPAVELIADGIDAISPLIDVIVLGMKGIGAILKFIFPIVKGMLFPFKMIGIVLEKITSSIDTIAGGLSGINPIVNGVITILEGLGAVIGSIFVVRNIGSFFGFISSGFGSIIKIVGSIIPMIGGTLGSLFQTLTGITTSTVKSATDATTATSATAQSSIASTTAAAKVAMSEMASVSTAATQAVSAAAKSVDVASSTTKAVSGLVEVEKAAESAATATKKVKVDAGDPSKTKSLFKAISVIGATTIAAMSTQMISSLFKAKEEGDEVVESTASSMIPLFGTAIATLGPMLFDSLSHGVEKFTRKQIEGKLETAMDKPLKKVRKKLEQIGDPIEKSITSKAGAALGKLKDKFKSFTQKGLLGKIFGTPKDIPVDEIVDTTETVTKKVEDVVTTKKTDIVDVVKPKSIGDVKVDDTPKKSVMKIFQSIGDFIKSGWETIKSSVKDVIQFGIDVIKQIANGITDVGKTLLDGIKGITSKVFDILKISVKSVKSILGDIVSFAAQSVKTLTSAIGTGIKNILKGIGDGLSSFKGSAIKGAAALVVLSGALWISSKAIQNFAQTEWEDVAKAGVVLGGLVIAGLALGSASPAMLIGAAALAGMGAALLITGIALQKFINVGWEDLGKAAASIVGLGVASAAFGAMAPLILVGTGAMVVASSGILVFAGSIELLSASLSNIDVSPLTDLGIQIRELLMIPASDLFSIALAITAVGASMVAFSSMRLGSSVVSSVSGLFENDLLTDLQKFAELANPLQIVANSIQSLGESLAGFASTVDAIDFDKINELSKLSDITVEQRMYSDVRSKLSDAVPNQMESSPEIKVVPVPMPIPKVLTPRKDAVAQDVRIVDSKYTPSEQGVKNVVASPMTTQVVQGQSKNNTDDAMIFNQQDVSMRDILFTLRDAVRYLEVIAKKNPNMKLDGYTVGKVIRAGSNNK